MKQILGQLLQEYLRQKDGTQIETKIEQLEIPEDVKNLLTTVREAIKDLIGDLDSQKVNLEDILLCLTNSTVDVYVQTSKKVSEILDIPLPNYQKEFELLDEKGIEVKFVWDVQEGWKVKKVSKNLTSVLGYQSRDFYLGILTYSQIVYEEDLERVQSEVEYYLSKQRTEYVQEYRVKKQDGTVITILDKTYVEYNEEGKPLYIYGYIYNIEDTKRLERKITDLQSELEVDSKTGEKSHSRLIHDLEDHCLKDRPIDRRVFKGIPILGPKTSEQVCETTRSCDQCNFTVLKITNFDRILSFCKNDTQKTTVTKEIIRIIKTRFDGKVSFYSISDGKYGMIGPIKLSKEKVEFSDEVDVNGEKFTLNVIFGGVASMTTRDSGIEVYKLANLVMKHQDLAESTGFYYTPELEERIKQEEIKQQALDSTIISCLETDGFVPYYQGIRDNITGTISKFEVLGRVNYNGSNYRIYEYLERLSETSKLPIAMRKIIDKVIEKLVSSTNIDISLNFSQSELNEDFIVRFVERLQENNINRTRITIEVLETTNSKEDITHIVKILKKLGFKIAIDDFGTGYSNIERLLQIQPDFLKIDGSLIHGISKDQKKLEVVRAFLEIAKILKAEVVAEKIEDQVDQSVLEVLGVRYTQGYLFSKPGPAF